MGTNKPIIVLDGARVEIDREDILILVTPAEWESQEQVELLRDQLSSFAFGVEFVLASRQSDGQILAVAPERIRAKLQKKINDGLEWTKVPIVQSQRPPK